jgi:tRNA(fMet)-specific endonuclease VapC
LELKYGAELSDKVIENRKTVEEFAKKVMVLPINTCSDIFAKEKARLRKEGNINDNFDLFIGCTAVAEQLIMVTDNEQHFNRINNITIENWVTR